MNDTQEPTAAQKKENIIKALTITGFTENPEYPRMYAKINGNIKTIIDLTAGTSAYLYDIVNTCKITDDPDGILRAVVELITKAEDGQMPTKSDADEVVHVPKKGDVPPPESNEPEAFDPPEPAQDTTDIGTVPAVPEAPQACAPTELVRSTAPPAPFVPQGTMIKDILPGLAEIGAIKIGGKGDEKKLSKMFKDGNPIIVPIEQIELNKEHIKELTGAEKVASEMRSDRNE